jgi:hypothetical protein
MDVREQRHPSHKMRDVNYSNFGANMTLYVRLSDSNYGNPAKNGHKAI